MGGSFSLRLSKSVMTKIKFADLALNEGLQRAVRAQGYEQPTPIQAQAIPHLLQGRDLLGIAQTGTGKTAAFTLPMLHRLSEHGQAKPHAPRALVLTPTRELAIQIGQNTASYGRHLAVQHGVIFGGVGQGRQVRRLETGVDILIATPGRLLDLMGQGYVRLQNIEIFVLDEADRMLDMGFIKDVQRVISKLPSKRQTLLFSATMPNSIVRLAEELLTEPTRVEVTPPATTVERIEQQVLFVEKPDKRKLLAELLVCARKRSDTLGIFARPDSGRDKAGIDRAPPGQNPRDSGLEAGERHPGPPAEPRVLVFARTKYGADRAAHFLRKAGIEADAIHGNKSQTARERALTRFRDGKVHVLVATDIAARGIDVPDITHVINFDLPNTPEDYVHRIGRTARAGRDGIALSFCDKDERANLLAIQRRTKRNIRVVQDHPFRSRVPVDEMPEPPKRRRGRRPPNKRGSIRRSDRHRAANSRASTKGTHASRDERR